MRAIGAAHGSGLADQARETAREGFDEALMDPLILLRFEVLRLAVCPVAFMIGDQVAAEEAVTTMSGLAAGANAVFWKLISQLFEGTLHIRRGAFETGLAVLRTALAAWAKDGSLVLSRGPEPDGGRANRLAAEGVTLEL